MKTRFIILVVVNIFLSLILIALIFLLVTPGFTSRHEFDQAFLAWHQNPNMATEAELEHQRKMNSLLVLEMDGIVVVLIAVTGYGLVRSWRSLNKNR
jgi:hypothetical protein